MTAVELLTAAEATPDNPAWHEARRNGLSASEIAAVLGISPWQSPFSLYWSKVNGWDQADAEHLEAGRRMESAIADWAADRIDPHGNLAVLPAGLYAHPERPWQLATPDRVVAMRELCGSCDAGLPMRCTCDELPPVAVLEVKHPSSWDGFGDDGTDDIPVYYRAQLLWQMDVLGVDEGYLGAYASHELRIYHLKRDERDLEVMREAGRRFMHRLEVGDVPDVDEHTATAAALKRLHPSLVDEQVQVDAQLAEGYRRARALAARADAAVKGFEARLREAMGPNRKAMCGDRLVASRSVYERKPYEVGPATVDRLNPGRAATYL